MTPLAFDPATDLKLERVIDVPKDLVWKAWTTPDLLKQWFCPKPWSVSDCVIDLRPGGRFHTMMRSPEGEGFPNEGCYLEVIPGERLTWTDALTQGFHPSPKGYLDKLDHGFYLTATVTFEAVGNKTKYTAYALHRNGADAQKHESHGFSQGWGAALDQLVELCKRG